ncbi:hypothetical protein K493DRAFT_333272 [Basidiobolus meristosporus CBS 931.73]|uniref:Nitrogen regulatory protein areA GATA-like domain-containing protein n=1 Tax=Basidiobolus meristosporus CBS 931.73 TaxID=1314790 RepID=A0A1Y1Z730_9FUNG|nr:hypothetical protein K493DRAFT_333272 [Basidiobolus meristosporus CBS 931.73]|eukprot:ORY06070.1 hypothetical protein K493DRAFT_333272 [Basidiobolus meristosporus CBS 931.73]
MEHIDLSYSENIFTEQPSMCVDYLSHNWTEEDLKASWKIITKSKKSLDNGSRLENACWRSWAKKVNNLMTVTPESLNWQKDSDITWLYGPFHTHTKTIFNTNESLKQATSTDGLKPVLKKVDSSDLFLNSRISLSKSAVFLRKVSSFERSEPVKPEDSRPKLRFNNQVEQCVAISSDEDDFSDEEGIVFNTHPSRRANSTILKIQPTRLKQEPMIRESHPWSSSTDYFSAYDEDDLSIFEKEYWSASDEGNAEIISSGPDILSSLDKCLTVANNLYDIVSWLSATIMNTSIF